MPTAAALLTDAAGAVRAFDLLPANVEKARALVRRVLVEDGWPADDAEGLATGWVQVADYLLRPADGDVDLVIGNPPYVRLEDVPDARMHAIRLNCPTMTGRSPAPSRRVSNARCGPSGWLERASSAPTGGCATNTADTCGR